MHFLFFSISRVKWGSIEQNKIRGIGGEMIVHLVPQSHDYWLRKKEKKEMLTILPIGSSDSTSGLCPFYFFYLLYVLSFLLLLFSCLFSWCIFWCPRLSFGERPVFGKGSMVTKGLVVKNGKSQFDQSNVLLQPQS